MMFIQCVTVDHLRAMIVVMEGGGDKLGEDFCCMVSFFQIYFGGNNWIKTLYMALYVGILNGCVTAPRILGFSTFCELHLGLDNLVYWGFLFIKVRVSNGGRG